MSKVSLCSCLVFFCLFGRTYRLLFSFYCTYISQKGYKHRYRYTTRNTRHSMSVDCRLQYNHANDGDIRQAYNDKTQSVEGFYSIEICAIMKSKNLKISTILCYRNKILKLK